MNDELLARLRGKLIVSCQDYEEVMIPVAIASGAAGLRLNGPRAVRVARSRTALPILACNKMYFPQQRHLYYAQPAIGREFVGRRGRPGRVGRSRAAASAPDGRRDHRHDPQPRLRGSGRHRLVRGRDGSPSARRRISSPPRFRTPSRPN